MLDGLLGRSFTAKCKSLIKLTKSRIEVIRRKRRATEKFLKKDIADLLLNGLDINAYGRAEGLMVELTRSSCYDFVEQSCDLVLKHLSVLQKLSYSGCPEECREAVSSLMFAAARFSDLPELRDLRPIFQERYGNSLECYVNQKFAANLNFKSSTLEKKVRLMRDITSEFSILWDSQGFELRMSKSSAFAQGQNTRMPNHLTYSDKASHGKDAIPNGLKYDDDVLFEKSPNHPHNDRHRFQNGKEAVVSNIDGHDLLSKPTLPANGVKPLNGVEVLQQRDGNDNPLTGRQEINAPKKSDRGYLKEGSMLKPIGRSSQEKNGKQFEGGSKLHDSWGNTGHLRENKDPATGRKSPSREKLRIKNEPSYVNQLVGLADTDNYIQGKKDETQRLKPCYSNGIPPPYVKPNSKQQNIIGHGANLVSHTDSDGISTAYPSEHDDRPNAASTSEKIQFGLDDSDQDWHASRHERLSKKNHEKEISIPEDANEVPLFKPKSIRRKHSRSRSRHNDATNVETGLVRESRSRSRRREESRRGLQVLFDEERIQNAQEERIIDKLLIHYSKKPSILVPEKVRRNSKMDNSARESLQNARELDESDETTEMVAFPPRSVSLPREQTGAVKFNNKVFNRAASFQPDRTTEARHVHPKLPDYDDLAATFAALRGR